MMMVTAQPDGSPTHAVLLLNRQRSVLFQSPESRREHSAAWKEAFIRDEEGLTRLQREWEDATCAQLGSLGFTIASRSVGEIPDNQFIRAHIAGTDCVVWFHDDTIGFDCSGKGVRFEHWDFEDPRAMHDAFMNTLRTALPGQLRHGAACR